MVLLLTLKTRIVQYVNPYIPIVLLRPTKSGTQWTALSVITRMKIMEEGGGHGCGSIFGTTAATMTMMLMKIMVVVVIRLFC